MRNKFLTLFALLLLCVVTISLQSCGDKQYTVWTASTSYSEFSKAYGITISDGYYTRVEVSNSQWEEMSKNLTKEGRHRWDEQTIKKWLIANGFGESEANKEASWLVLTNHGLIVSRYGNTVNFMLK